MSEQRSSKQIVLVGLPGAGKSTVGPILAERLGWRFVDFDPIIESEAGLSIGDIFARLGEAEFRRRESELTARLASEPHLVLSPGGGWILRNQLPDALIIWLKVDSDEAVRRLGGQAVRRPLLKDDPMIEMQKLLEERKAKYANAQIQIDTTGSSADDVVNAIIREVQERNGNEESK